MQPRLGKRADSILGGLQRRPEENLAVEEGEHNPAPKNTDEQATKFWRVMEQDRKRESNRRVRLDTPSVHAIRDKGPLIYPGKSSIVNG